MIFKILKNRDFNYSEYQNIDLNQIRSLKIGYPKRTNTTVTYIP